MLKYPRNTCMYFQSVMWVWVSINYELIPGNLWFHQALLY